MAGVELATAYVSVMPNAKGFAGKVDREISPGLANVGEEQGKNVGSRIAGGVKKVVAGGFLAAGGVAATALTKGFGRLKSLDEAEGKLKGLGHSTKSVDKIMSNALASVKGTAFGMDEAATTAAGAVAAGVKPGKDLESVLTLVGDAATIAGTDMGSMGAIFNKVASTGKIQGDVIAQLGDQGIPILQFLSAETGKSAAEVSKMASEGKIDFETFRKAMESGLGGAAQESGSTFTGAFKNMQAALGRLGANLLSGIFPKMKTGFGGVTEALDKMGPAAEAVGKKIGTSLSGAADAVGRFAKSDSVKNVFGEAVGSVRAFGAAWRYNDGEITSSGLPGFMERVGYVARQAFDKARDAVGLLLPHIKTFGSDLRDLLGPIGTLGKALGETLVAAFKAMAPYLKAVAAALGVAFVAALKVIPPVLRVVIGALTGILNLIRPMLPLIAALASAYLAYRGALIAVSLATKAVSAVTAAYRAVMVALYAPQAVWTAGKYAFAAAERVYSAAVAGGTGAVKARTIAEKIGMAVARVRIALSKVAAAATLAWSRATSVATLATVRQTIAEKAKLFWSKAVAVATKAWAATQWLLNAALSANPIALVVIALVALGAGLVLAYKKSETFRRIVNAAWAGIKAAALATVSWFTGTALPWLKNAFTAIGSAARGLYTNYIKPAFSAIGAVIKWLWSNVVKPYFGFILSTMSRVFGWVKNKGWPIFKSAITAVGRVVKWLWTSFIRPYFGFILSRISSVFGWVKNKGWPIFKSAITAVGRAAKWLWSSFIRPYFGFILSKISSVFGWIKDKGWPKIRGAFQSIGDKAKWLWNAAKTPFSRLKSGIGSVKDAIGRAAKGIKSAWSKVNEYLRAPIRKGISWMNSKMIGGLNSLLSTKILSIPKKWRIPKIKGFDVGGWTGPGGRLTPAGIVHADEFVVKKRSRRRFERENPGALDHINRTGRMPGYADGGRVADRLPGYRIGGKVAGLNKRFLEQLHAFNAAAGGRYTVNSGYRSNSHQARLYARYLAGRGPVAAKPGSSMHNRGLAADLAPSDARNVHGAAFARRFGLVYTVPSESWHIEPSWGRGSNAGPSSGGGGGWGLPSWLSSPIKWVKDKVAGITKKFDASKYGVAGQVLPAVSKRLRDVVGDKIKKAADSLMSFGGGSSQSVNFAGIKGGTNKILGKGMAERYGWTGHQWNALSRLWDKESNWNHTARNPSSGAYGIPQSLPASKMRSAGADYLTNPKTQIAWGLKYIKDRYGNPASALAFHNRKNWYADGGRVARSILDRIPALEFDRGGILPEGRSMVVNNTGRPEPLRRTDLDGATGGGSTIVYVQNPWTAEYHEARMARIVEEADDFKASIGRMR